MIKLGIMNLLKVVEITDKGCFLDADGENVFIPLSQMKPDTAIGDEISVFLYKDDGRLTATGKRPKALVGEIALLTVVSTSKYGYFLDNSIRKDVFLPFDQVKGALLDNDEVLVYLYLDHEDRLCATTRYTSKFAEIVPQGYKTGDRVKVMPESITNIGIKAVVENRFYAMFLKNEEHHLDNVKIGKKIYAYISRIREDRRVDLVLNPIEDILERKKNRIFKPDEELKNAIIKRLELNEGYLPFCDKTDPKVLDKIFHCSKGKFKQAIGNLKRDGLIEFVENGIRCIKK